MSARCLVDDVDNSAPVRAMTLRHCVQAHREGWGLFLSDERGLEIQRDDERGVFKTDAAALAFVQGRAARGDEAARRALQAVRTQELGE